MATTASKLDTFVPTGAPAPPVEVQVAAAVTKEAASALRNGGGPLVQWLLIVGLYIGGIVHVLGDGTVRERSERTEALVVDTERRLAVVEALVYWLAECEAARQDGTLPPRFPIPQRPTP